MQQGLSEKNLDQKDLSPLTPIVKVETKDFENLEVRFSEVLLPEYKLEEQEDGKVLQFTIPDQYNVLNCPAQYDTLMLPLTVARNLLPGRKFDNPKDITILLSPNDRELESEVQKWKQPCTPNGLLFR